MAGKKTIGTANPGKSSGVFMLNGNEIDMGIITQAKEIMENKKLNTFLSYTLIYWEKIFISGS